jgi:hypothetical protein
MNTKIQIPTYVLQHIYEKANAYTLLNNLSDKSFKRLIVRFVEMWYFIYTKQTSKDGNQDLRMYVNISNDDLVHFKIMLEGSILYYTDILNELSSLISINDKYKKGEFTKGYKINTNKVDFSDVDETEIDFKVIYKNYKTKEEWIKKYPKYKLLIETAYRININLLKYKKYLLEHKGDELKPYYSKSQKRTIERFLDEETIYRHYNMALKIQFRNMWFKVSNEGRFYSSISNMPGTVLDSESITIYGKKLLSIDVVNCQPLLLAALVHCEEYMKDCANGVFYERMCEESHGNDFKLGDKRTKKNLRGKMKLDLYKYVFFGDNKLKSGEVYDCMEKLYKGLIHQINALKIELGKDGLVKKLQTIESNIFVKGCMKFNNVLLRHDEVIFIEGDDKSIIKKLRKGFNDNGIFNGKIKLGEDITEI